MSYKISSFVFSILTLFTITLVLSGCGTDPEAVIESQDYHVCEHFTDGPFSDVTAAETQSDAIARADSTPGFVIQHLPHTVYRVALNDRNDHFDGYVVFYPTATEVDTHDYVIYMDKSVAPVIYDVSDSNRVITPEMETTTVAECHLIRYKAIVEFTTGHEYALYLNSDTNEQISMIIPALEDDVHDH
ncbi:MAG: hypothetical protein K9N34_09530 [Candidatus Marinimicrobia bacterium]|nr:hypothetical protein [Candidatus Neomarinimicrobiota bacterium]MCF7840818.1 hypothetical protein [Candidatus Neomarinimicrobiota bacterium]MCF7903206.1 hypothetical protein [Candidatus Neomarinimicrobiota bacterium]